MPVDTNNIDDVFTYHAPSEEQIVKYATLRQSARLLGRSILSNTPVCADQQASLRLLRECLHMANAAIALEGRI
jgi:hypothetical protein